MTLGFHPTEFYNFATSHNVLLAKLTEGDKHRLLTNKKAQQATLRLEDPEN